MLKHWIGGAVVMAAVVGAGHAQTAPRVLGGTIHFVGRIVEGGYAVQMAPGAAPGQGGAAGLQTQAATSDGRIVLGFSSQANKPVPAEVSVEARTVSSPAPLRVGDARSGADVHVAYNGFRATQAGGSNLLMGARGTLTVSRPAGTEPALAVVMIAYR
ncbi:hypothetical protein [uncultured Ralstonia sp.]|jgi:hypothetical protein|uniref:hypothetical protein n=1 Tax=Ralstonia sp. TaxID=54061 RepID=UPI0025EAF710|nr:hypothetical protein [uncultured Ralstonia sp.]